MFGRGVVSLANENLEREGVSKRKRGKREKVKFVSFSDRKSERLVVFFINMLFKIEIVKLIDFFTF